MFIQLTLALFSLTLLGSDASSCLTARNRCTSRIGCGMALNNFLVSCESVMAGMVDHCTDTCMRAVISLVTVDDNIGADYLTCSCEGDCALMKKRVGMCSEGVLKALETLDNQEVISCSLARMLCEADTQCWTALQYFEDRCSNLWEQYSPDALRCSDSCNNSLTILYRQTRAAKLSNCMCDNTDPLIDENMCIRMRYNTDYYCLKKQTDWSFLSSIVTMQSSKQAIKDSEPSPKPRLGQLTSHSVSIHTAQLSLAVSLFWALLH